MNSYRVVIHAHSKWSYDGTWEIAELANLLSRFGVKILMMTEHSQRFDYGRIDEYYLECKKASNNKIRVIPGIEYSTEKNEIHILTWGSGGYLGEELSVEKILDAIEKDKGISIFAHPSRRDAWKKFNPNWASRLYGIEIWNRKTDNVACSDHAYQLIQTYPLQPIVSLDFHNKKQLYPLYNILKSDKDIFSLSNAELIALITKTTLKPKFFGLPADGSGRMLAETTHIACKGLQYMHKIFFRSR